MIPYTRERAIALGKMFDAQLDALALDDAYYASRERGFTAVEHEIARWCADNLPQNSVICEVGCGVGHLSVLLESIGFYVRSVDADHTRIAAAEEISRTLGTERLTYHCGHYPDSAPACDIIAATNVMGGWWDAQPGTEAEKARRFFRTPAIIAPHRWYTTAGYPRDEEGCALLEADFGCMGLRVYRISNLIWRVEW